MDVQNATARLRRTFAYPPDNHDNHSDNGDSSDSSPEAAALDEQEQEELIASLAAQNAARNAQFRLFLLALPACSALPYLAALLRAGAAAAAGGDGGGGGGGGRVLLLVSALGLSSLASTAWMLRALPPGVTGIAALDAWIAGEGASTSAAAQKSPLEIYLPYLNVGLCAVLMLIGFVGKPGAAGGQWGHVGLGNLPALVYAVVLVAKAVMGGVDPERELSGLRYEYKGA